MRNDESGWTKELTKVFSGGLINHVERMENDRLVKGSVYNLKGIKGKISFFVSFPLSLLSWHDACQPRSGRIW